MLAEEKNIVGRNRFKQPYLIKIIKKHSMKYKFSGRILKY